MAVQPKVKNPKLTLIAFQLRNSLESGDEPVENASHLWTKCGEIGKSLNAYESELESLIERLSTHKEWTDDVSNDYQELLPERFVPFVGNLKPQIKGTFYPIQLHDTYAVDITLYQPQTEVYISQLHQFVNPDYCLLPNNIQSDLGQTLIFFGEPVKCEDDRKFADDCVRGLLPTAEADKLSKNPSQGQLLGSPIFEYSTGDYHPERQTHLLIWLNTSEETRQLEEKGKYYQPLINLLCYRHKILYAYRQSRWCYHQAKTIFQALSPKAKTIEELTAENLDLHLESLKRELLELPNFSFRYVNLIQQIKIHLNTIKTNFKNYQYSLDNLREIMVKEDSLEFCNQFIRRTEKKIIGQIEVDLEYLIPGQALFSELINTIRGLVEIEQAERDRSLEHTIQIWGAGLGAGGIVASAVSGHLENGLIVKNEQNQNVLNPAIHGTIFLSLSAFILVGGIVGYFNGGLADLYRDLKNKFQKPKG